MTDDTVFGTVRCCRDWPIVYMSQGQLWPWRVCGLCRELPTLVHVDGESWPRD